MEHVRVPLVGTPRERVRSADELKAVYATARAGKAPFHRIVALLVLTGQRRGEIAALQWAWIGENTITLPSTHTKNRREHTFPIGEAARDVLRDRKSVVSGKRVSVRVDLGGRRLIKKKKKNTRTPNTKRLNPQQ